jgi:hypothetical protein
MPDVINHIENTETGKADLWITIKDASDLLGISERHTWRILLQNAWKTQKLPNKDRKKTYVLRPDVEKYFKAEQERQRLEQLKSSPLSDIPDTSDMSDKSGLFDMSDIVKKPMSDIKNLPILMSDYRNILTDLQKKQEQLVANATRWKTTAIWIGVLAVFIAGFMGSYLYDTKKAMSDNKREMSDRINDLSDKVAEAQKEITSAKEALFQKEIWINRLEQVVPQEKREELNIKKGD